MSEDTFYQSTPPDYGRDLAFSADAKPFRQPGRPSGGIDNRVAASGKSRVLIGLEMTEKPPRWMMHARVWESAARIRVAAATEREGHSPRNALGSMSERPQHVYIQTRCLIRRQ